MPSDEQGIDVDWIEAYVSRHPVKAVYVVPNFGNRADAPSAARRQQLVRLAARTGTYLIEDDPYGELRLSGSPVASIQALAAGTPAQARTLYLSSFSKILSPGLRVGWMVLPPALFEQAALAKQAIDLHSCSLSQRLIGAYLAAGRLAPRLAVVLRDAYRQRRDALVSALRRHLVPRSPSTSRRAACLWARFAPETDAARVLKAALDAGVIFVHGAALPLPRAQHAACPIRRSTKRGPKSVRYAAKALRHAGGACCMPPPTTEPGRGGERAVPPRR